MFFCCSGSCIRIPIRNWWTLIMKYYFCYDLPASLWVFDYLYIFLSGFLSVHVLLHLRWKNTFLLSDMSKQSSKLKTARPYLHIYPSWIVEQSRLSNQVRCHPSCGACGLRSTLLEYFLSTTQSCCCHACGHFDFVIFECWMPKISKWGSCTLCMSRHNKLNMHWQSQNHCIQTTIGFYSIPCLSGVICIQIIRCLFF
jgi:hypothetical protein